jgi:Bacterial Ig-like domain
MVLIMKKLLTILFLFALSANATTYYVRTDGSNSNTGTTNSSGGAWLTLVYAAAHTTSGDIISIQPGTYTETAQVFLPVGVSLEGTDSSTCIIKSTYNLDQFKGIIDMVSTVGTNGNQHISNLKFDGSSLLNDNCFDIEGRSNVKIFNCSFRDFKNSAAIFNGAQTYITTAPSVYATGNEFYNNRVMNCAQYTSNGSGALSIGGQQGMLIYNNNINQTQRASGSNGWPIKFYSEGFLKGVKIYNNTLTKIPFANDGWDFAVELWNLSGLEFYGNTVQGSLDLNWQTKDTYKFSAYVHHNTFSQSTQNSYKETGIYFEFGTEDAIVEYNTFDKIASPLVFVPRANDTIRNFIFRRNLCTNLGATGTQDINFVSFFDNISVVVNGYYIYNNTFVGLTGANTPYNGFKFLESGTRSNVFYENNIINNTVFGGITFAGSGAFTNAVIRGNNTYNTGGIGISGTTPSPIINTGNITTDPLLIGTTDTLGTGSPAIDAGFYVGYPYNGSAPDIGYDERGAPDFTAPTITATIPTSGATGVSTVNPDTVSFSEIMMVDSINSRTFQLKQGSTVIPTTINFIDSVRWTMTPVSQLSAFTTYTISITTNVKDAAGNNLASAFTSTFTTGALVNVPPTANAGADSTVNYPTRSSVSLIGTATDSDGSIASTFWSLKYGANTPTITTSSSLTTTVTGLIGGYYVFYLTATDNQGATGKDSVTIWVADAANVYATWNPSDKSASILLSNSNKTEADNSGGTLNNMVRATIALPDSAYWEVTPTLVGSQATYFLRIGVSRAGARLDNPNDDGDSSWSIKPDGNKAHAGSYSAYSGGFTSGDVISMLWTRSDSTWRTWINGVNKGVVYTGVSGAIYASAGFQGAEGSVTINTGATFFAYPPPQGYKAIYTGGTVISPQSTFQIKGRKINFITY